MVSSDCHALEPVAADFSRMQESMDTNTSSSSNSVEMPKVFGPQDAPLADLTGDLIPLGRIPGQAATICNSKAPKPQQPAIMEGWMLHFTK